MTVHKNWYVVYTRPRWEKKLHDGLLRQDLESFLPTYITIRQWSDRKKKVELPLFTSYLFVHVSKKEYYKVLNTDGAVKYIYYQGKPATVSEEIIDSIKRLINSNVEFEIVSQKLPIGTKVIIKEGILKGIIGEIIQYKGSLRACIRVDQIDKSIFVSIPLNACEEITD